MGDVGNFFLGGSKQKSKNSSSSSSSSSSENQSQNSAVNGSINNSSNQNASASNSNGYNLGYGPIAAAMTPTLGYTSAGGNMLGALLGIPGYSATGGPAPASSAPYDYHPPAPASLPQPPALGAGTNLLTSLMKALGGPAKPVHVPALPPLPAPTPTTDASGGGGMTGSGLPPTGGAIHSLIQRREFGGPVTANQPYVVGERQPEVFVPHTSGTIVPSMSNFQTMFGNRGNRHGGGVTPPIIAPGQVPPVAAPPAPVPMPPTVAPPAGPVDPNPQGTALNTFFDSSGGKFLMNQGQNAINSNASAGGFLQSGATGKALEDYGQGLASKYMNDYINHVLDFSKLGLGGASAMTGAGGVNNTNSRAYGSGGSSAASYGSSQGTNSGMSQGTSTSTGTGTSSGNSKKGLIPDLTAAAAAAASGGAGGAGA